MSRSFIEASLPLGDRDDAPPLNPPEPARAPVAGRKPEAPLMPELDLHLPRIEQALSDAATAYADLMAARARKDLPMVKSAALRLCRALQVDLKALSSHVARAVSALPRERQLQPTMKE